MRKSELFLADGEATERLGSWLARCSPPGVLLFLYGDLGAGKTTLVRGFLQEMGHRGAVKSPTYTLVEPYDLQGRRFYHFDLYRLGSPEELEYLGIRDYFDGTAVSLIEWPQRGIGMLPDADLEVHLGYRDEGRSAHLVSLSPRGEMLLACVLRHQTG